MWNVIYAYLLQIPDVASDPTIAMSAIDDIMDDDEPVNVNGDPMLSSPHGLTSNPLLASPTHRSTVADAMLCDPRLPSPTSHIDPVEGETLDMDMIAWSWIVLDFSCKRPNIGHLFSLDYIVLRIGNHQ